MFMAYAMAHHIAQFLAAVPLTVIVKRIEKMRFSVTTKSNRDVFMTISSVIFYYRCSCLSFLPQSQLTLKNRGGHDRPRVTERY